MAKKILHVGFVLDESGSMFNVKSQTISGFNEYVDTLRDGKNSKSVRFTLTKFNSSEVGMVYKGEGLDNVPPLTNETYIPSGLTPLYDAIGRTVRSLEKNVRGKSPSVLVVIQTDGFENMSTEFSQKKIFDLIEDKKKVGWTFVFIGADQDAWLASQSLGISLGNTMNYDSRNTKGAFRTVATASSGYAESGGVQTSSFFADTDEGK